MVLPGVVTHLYTVTGNVQDTFHTPQRILSYKKLVKHVYGIISVFQRKTWKIRTRQICPKLIVSTKRYGLT